MSRVIPPHLTKGSTRPPLVEGKLRLYSMEYCPFAQRVRLVLLAKKIPHDIVNINLIEKPEWYFDVNPKGLVPAIDTGSEVIVESLDIANWLDKNYAQNPLIPSDPAAQDRDQRVISEIGDLVKVYSGILFSQETQKSENAVKNLNPSLRFLENELASRNSVFFGGDKPSMVDYMLWPWGERSGTLSHVLGEKPPFSSDQFPALKNWKKAMREDSVCDQIYHGPEIFWKVVQNKKQGIKHYENIYS